MIKRTFHQIVTMLSADHTVHDDQLIAIQGVSTDSRTVSEGNLFIPLIGDNFDAHTYVKEIVLKGASASLWQKDHEHPPEGIPLIFVEDTLAALQKLAEAYRSELSVRTIGITGSNGKTTTKDLIASILSTTYKVHKTKGNLNNHIGLPLTILELDEDTEMAVLEMGMSGRGEIELLSKLAKPEVVVITNIGEAHLQQLGSREEIAKAKLEICAGLQPGGLLVYNGDEPLLEKANHPSFSIKKFRFGASSSNDYFPTGMMMDREGSHFTLNTKNSPSFFIPLLGQHNVINAIAAIAVCKYMGVQEPDLHKGLRLVQMSGMRIEIVKGYNGVTILNDAYNASPTSMRAALQLMQQLSGYDKKIVVIGDMLELGENEKQFHAEIGKLLNPDSIDYIFTYGKLAEIIAKEASKRYESNKIRIGTNKKDIAKEIMQLTNSRDLVLVKGSRGMKLEEVVNSLVQGRDD